MNTLKDHTILYDDECPACARYTQTFVDTNMIESKGRKPFSSTAVKFSNVLDQVRASNEIALINDKTGEVTYGIDSLFKIFEHNFPTLKIIFRNRVFHWLMTKLYFFISYNRKAIVPGKDFEGCNTCAPTLNYNYRWAFIVFSWIITSIILSYYVGFLAPYVTATSFGREFLICGGQIIFQALILALINKKRIIYYLGNLMTVSLGGAILLLPAFLINNLVTNNLFYLGYFGIVVSIMLYEHVRRVKILQLPVLISVTWVAYRLIVLLIIL